MAGQLPIATGDAMRRISVLGFAIACFIAGALVQRLYDAPRRRQSLPPVVVQPSAIVPAAVVAAPPPVPYASIHFEQEPLWAYGVERPPQPGEKAVPQAPPSRALRTDQSAEEQTRPRHIPGSL